jgi:hypothetical protein
MKNNNGNMYTDGSLEAILFYSIKTDLFLYRATKQRWYLRRAKGRAGRLQRLISMGV